MLLLLACRLDEALTCENGLDINKDGVCDRDVADWSEGARLPDGGDRHNIYQLSEAELAEVTLKGQQYATSWPVNVSGMLMPADPFEALFAETPATPEIESFQTLARPLMGFGTMEEMFDWLGLARFPEDGSIAIPEDQSPGDVMGYGRVATEWGDAVTFSCYSCHATEFYGHTLIGLQNRRTRANEYLLTGQQFFPQLTPELFQSISGATDAEVEMFLRAQEHIPAIGGKVPQAHGLDTSLASVSLSLSKRTDDAWATLDPNIAGIPAANELNTFVADSKPAVWWNLRYKTRWLSDGSVVSGNPIFTNFLWNELGRGTDLHEMGDWMSQGGAQMDALTVAVFNTPAPRWNDIFPQFPIDETLAQAGATVYENNCATCHGSYEKGWDHTATTGSARLDTIRLIYSAQTQVIDVGTDLQRAQGMDTFADRLNRLALSEETGTVVVVQEGYVPPPLDAIWARFPYLHNASVPSLCALLTPTERPEGFWTGPPDDPATDFDPTCVGLPTSAPEKWQEDPQNWYDTSIPGLSALGHSSMMTEEVQENRAALIEFLKTL